MSVARLAALFLHLGHNGCADPRLQSRQNIADAYVAHVKHSDGKTRALAISLSGLAGYVDAIGFIQIGGFFVSFMSGNSTRFAVGMARGEHGAIKAGGLIAGFMVGVIAGALVGHFSRNLRRPMILAIVALLLALAAGLGATGNRVLAVVIMAIAMGAENAVFQENGEVRIGVTYMTGALVKTGQHFASALVGGDKWGWLPHFLLWVGLVSGATMGALAYSQFGLGALWLGSAVAGVAAVAAARI